MASAISISSATTTCVRLQAQSGCEGGTRQEIETLSIDKFSIDNLGNPS
jgi:hypothetical protein